MELGKTLAVSEALSFEPSPAFGVVLRYLHLRSLQHMLL